MSGLRVVLSGATGRAGSALARAIGGCEDLRLAGAVSRTHAGELLSDVLGDARLECAVHASAHDALVADDDERCDVYVEYAKAAPETLLDNVAAALAEGAHVVVASSGLSDDDYAQLDALAQGAERAVLACGNFALTAVLLARFAEIAAHYVEAFEILDYARDTKADAPSGTARELAARVARVRAPHQAVPPEAVEGQREARGATLAGVQVHSVRLPGFAIGVEAIFGAQDQRLHLRYEAGAGTEAYVPGALMAIRRVATLPAGLHRGLDVLMER